MTEQSRSSAAILYYMHSTNPVMRCQNVPLHCTFPGCCKGFSGWFTPRYDFIDHRRSLGTGAFSTRDFHSRPFTLFSHLSTYHSCLLGWPSTLSPQLDFSATHIDRLRPIESSFLRLELCLPFLHQLLPVALRPTPRLFLLLVTHQCCPPQSQHPCRILMTFT